MAKITLGPWPLSNTQDVDQSDYVGDTLTVDTIIGNSTINIANSSGSDETLMLKLTRLSPIGGTTTVNIGENAHVGLAEGFDFSIGQVNNFNLADGATLQYSSATFSVGGLNSANFNLGAGGQSTLIYDPQGTNLTLFNSTPKVSGLSAGDQIQVLGATSGSVEGSELVFRDADGRVLGRFNAEGEDLSKVVFENGVMTYACFLKGTHIATPDGEAAVETLRAGDRVLTADGKVATVKWVGYRKLHKARIPARDAVRAFPITFQRGSIADNVPHRDLCLSPGHHVYFDGLLVPAMALVNGQTIVQDFKVSTFEYFHVELEEFGILLAEGLPAESYVDTGNRSMFQNAGEVALNPDFGPATGRPDIAGIKVAQQGPQVEAIRKRLLARAALLSGARLVKDAELCLMVGAQRVDCGAPCDRDGMYRFALPAGLHDDVRIVSNSAVVRDVSAHARRDLRCIGVGIVALSIETADGVRSIALDDAALQGFHPVQDVHGVKMRWTTGEARIPAALLHGATAIEVHVLRTYQYWKKAA